MTIKYEMSSRQLKEFFYIPLLKLFAALVVGTIVALVWFDVRSGQVLPVFGLTWAWFGLVHLMPFLILAVRHKRISEHASFTVDRTTGTCQYKVKGRDFSFELNQIEKVIQVVSPPRYDDRIDILGFGRFFYWKIILADGTILIMSCMLLDVENFFGEMSQREKKMFCMPPYNVMFRSTPGRPA